MHALGSLRSYLRLSLLLQYLMMGSMRLVGLLLAAAFLKGVHGAFSAVQGTGSTTRGWSCCKNTCSWADKAPVNNPVISCDTIDNLLVNPARRDGCESGGTKSFKSIYLCKNMLN